MREKIRTRQYVMTIHADDEMDEDGLTIYDVESVFLTGEIVSRQRDRVTRENKYLVRGRTVDGQKLAVTVSKFGLSDRLIILTVYVE